MANERGLIWQSRSQLFVTYLRGGLVSQEFLLRTTELTFLAEVENHTGSDNKSSDSADLASICDCGIILNSVSTFVDLLLSP